MMCGRFFNHLQAMHDWSALLASWPELAGDWPASGIQSYNIAPTQQVPIILSNVLTGDLSSASVAKPTQVVQARWGMIPSWAKSFDSRYATHNARLETVSTKPVFRSAWRQQQRCIVPAAGYYEWLINGKHKQPHAVRSSAGPLLFAGIWETWQQRYSFTVLTQPASEPLLRLHPRMPCMLSPVWAKKWIEQEAVDLARADGSLTASYYPVNTKVGNTHNEGPELIEPEPSFTRGFDF